MSASNAIAVMHDYILLDFTLLNAAPKFMLAISARELR